MSCGPMIRFPTAAEITPWNAKGRLWVTDTPQQVEGCPWRLWSVYVSLMWGQQRNKAVKFPGHAKVSASNGRYVIRPVQSQNTVSAHFQVHSYCLLALQSSIDDERQALK